MLGRIKKWYKNFTMSPYERYLSKSVSHEDLERRLKELERRGIWL